MLAIELNTTFIFNYAKLNLFASQTGSDVKLLCMRHFCYTHTLLAGDQWWPFL